MDADLDQARMSPLDSPGWRSNREVEATTSCRRTPSCAGSPSWRPRISWDRRLTALIPPGGGGGRVPATRRQSKPRFSRVNGTEQCEGLVGCRVGGRVDRTLTRFVPLGGRLLECLSCCLQGPNGTLNPYEPLSVIGQRKAADSLSIANPIQRPPRATHTLRTSRRPQP